MSYPKISPSVCKIVFNISHESVQGIGADTSKYYKSRQHTKTRRQLTLWWLCSKGKYFLHSLQRKNGSPRIDMETLRR